MQITEIRVPIYLAGYGEPRTPGLHLTTILRAIAIKTHILKEDPADLGLDFQIATVDPYAVGLSGVLMRCIYGYAFEDWFKAHVIKRAFPNAILKPGELFYQGIIGSPDAVDETYDWFTIHEIKNTFKKSPSKPDEPYNASSDFSNHLLYLYQGACYLKMASEQYHVPIKSCRVIYHPGFIRGNYRGIDPEYRPHQVTFEKEEVEGIWETVSRHRYLVEEGK